MKALPPGAGDLTGRDDLENAYANIATRSAAFLVDVVLIMVAFTLVGAALEWLFSVFLARDVKASDSGPLSVILLVLWAFVYFAYPLAVAGRTAGMAILGLRVVRADGGDLGAAASVVRVLALPLSFLLAGIGFLLIVLRRDHRALHDLISGSAVVYSWRARAAHLGFLTRPPAT
jgi:uncharacterized RDD family membrane protein YckC